MMFCFGLKSGGWLRVRLGRHDGHSVTNAKKGASKPMTLRSLAINVVCCECAVSVLSGVVGSECCLQWLASLKGCGSRRQPKAHAQPVTPKRKTAFRKIEIPSSDLHAH